MSILFYLSIMILGGMICGRAVKMLKLPNVTGYLIAGLLLGPYLLNVIPIDIVEQLGILSDVALGFIAFSIGSEFKISYFKRVGMTPIVIAIFEGVGAMIFVTGIMLALGYDFSFAIVLGAIASATAPAATVMVIKQYQAKGPVTETLLSVVALDDAVALISFGFAVTIANGSGTDASLVESILQPFWEVIISLLLGGSLGILFTIPMRWWKKDSNRLNLTYAFVFIAIAISNYVGASNLLVCMALGSVLINTRQDATHIFEITDYVTPPIFLLFFVLSGAELDITIIPSIGLVGIAYVVFRVIGKFLGTFTAAKIMKADEKISKYLGFALIPQAGVAIGLSLVAEQVLSADHGAVIRAVVLCATFIYEIIGPAVSKATLQKAGEIKPN